MPFLIGTDEAGYGPNLGPLVITATLWELPAEMTPADMWTALQEVVTSKLSRGDRRLHIADSKQVYSSGKSIRNLERGVLACLQQAGDRPPDVRSLGCQLASDAFAADYHAAIGGPQIGGPQIDELSLPVAATPDELAQDSQRLSDALQLAGIRFRQARSAILFAPEFNRRVAEHNSKGVVLSTETLRLVREAVDALEQSQPTGWVVCDKHGGRNRYDDLIADAFDGALVFRGTESGPRSEYRLGNIDFCFRTKAEELLPVAIASMIAKYTREVVMQQFNAYWQTHVPELKPTKGYPVDAARFWEDIAETCADMGVDKTSIWRCR